MKFLKKFYLFEKEMSKQWIDSNKDFYLIQNKELTKNKPESQTDDKGELLLTEIRTILKYISVDDLYAVLDRKVYKTDEWSVSVKENIHLLKLVNEYKEITQNRLKLKLAFQVEHPLNRIHAIGLSDKLFGIGLGYKMYKALINEIGYDRSSSYATNDNSRKIWYHLIQDSDYYTIVLNKDIKEIETLSVDGPTIELEGIMVISKKYNNIKELVKECEKTFKTIELDDELKKIMTLNEYLDYDDDGEEEEDEIFFEDLEKSKEKYGIIHTWNKKTGNCRCIIEPHSLKYNKTSTWGTPSSIKFTMIREEFLDIAKNNDYVRLGKYQRKKSKYRIYVNITSDVIYRKFTDTNSIKNVITFLTENNIPLNAFRFDKPLDIRENVDFDDEDEEEDDVYSEANNFIYYLNKSKEKWGVFNLLVGKYENPITCVIDTSGVSTYVASAGFLNIIFINSKLFDDYNTLVYNSINDFFETVDNNYTTTFRVYDNGSIGNQHIKFTSDDDKKRFINFVKQIDGIENKQEILSSLIDYLK